VSARRPAGIDLSPFGCGFPKALAKRASKRRYRATTTRTAPGNLKQFGLFDAADATAGRPPLPNSIFISIGSPGYVSLGGGGNAQNVHPNWAGGITIFRAG
jgi:hypothetical protein